MTHTQLPKGWTAWAVVAETDAGEKVHAAFQKKYQAEGEAWRVRKYQCRPARVVEMKA